MNSFEYYNPTHIVFGQSQISKLSELVPSDARVLITYGGGSAERTGTLDEVRHALNQSPQQSEQQTRKVFEFGGIEPNPEFDTLMQAVEVVRDKQIDFLLAVGGGSVIDGTKFIALVAGVDDDSEHTQAWEILLARGAGIETTLPLGTVLTIPATGSEMNSGGVINHSQRQAKLPFGNRNLFPKFSILDPSKTLTLPARQVVNGVADAFVHVMEQYLTYPTGAKVQDAYAESLLRILIEEGAAVQKDPDNMQTRENIMWSATMALNGLIGVGVPQDWTTHMIGHELTSLYGIDHARTLTIVLPAVMRELKDSKRDKLRQYASNVWHIHEGSEDEKIQQAIEKTESFFSSMGLPIRLSDVDLDESVIEKVVEQLRQHNMVKLGEHKANDPAVSRRILARAV